MSARAKRYKIHQSLPQRNITTKVPSNIAILEILSNFSHKSSRTAKKKNCYSTFCREWDVLRIQYYLWSQEMIQMARSCITDMGAERDSVRDATKSLFHKKDASLQCKNKQPSKKREILTYGESAQLDFWSCSLVLLLYTNTELQFETKLWLTGVLSTNKRCWWSHVAQIYS